ncbi:conserved hypothetical protein [Sporisorium reilianum SRZ2]|uniref:PH domain-containing protein n=1 Tax=Sporisorium reilianum (strain SRZ2) TaxID=999809 RepID=E6ZT90_SPORE|nr:conserved hypothetical protein [Sporisorium reilianum SRZ2]
MPASSTSTSAFDASVRNAIAQLQQQDSRYDHVVLATAEGSASRTAPFQLVALASGGLDALRAKLHSHETRFALLRVQVRILLVVSLGQGVSGLKRAQVLVQGRALQSSLGAILFATLTIASTSQLTSALVSSKLQLEGFAHVPSPDLNQDFRASWASTSAADVVTRARPSAPSSPGEVGLDASWSRPVSDVGPMHREMAALSSSLGSRAKSLLVAPSRQSGSASQGIVIDLASVIEAPSHATPTQPAQAAFPLLPAVDCGSLQQISDSPESLNAALTTWHSRTPSDPYSPIYTQSPRIRLSDDERKRLSDERERLRADEAIRDQVMKKLRAEQQSVLRSPVSRTPRLAVVPPLAPPPPFAPPPAPVADGVVATSPRVTCRPRLEDERGPASAPVLMVSESRGGMVGEACEGLRGPRSSESHESIRSSVHSLNLWEFAEAAARTDSFLHLPRRAPRCASGTATPTRVRSRQGSGSECATSSSRGSVAASSLFDKELPALPSDLDSTSNDGDEWIGDLPAHGSPTYSHPSLRAKHSAEEAALHDLRERLAHAEARAHAAEAAAQHAIREAHTETRRLADELARVERGARETMEAEAVRRAQWAREQAARDRLDAYERSRLEADETRRRRAIEEQRRLECDRAERIREERAWREHEAERVKLEYEARIRQLAEREALLKREAEARECVERERRERAREAQVSRTKRLQELTDAVRSERVELQGWINTHSADAVHSKRRWYHVTHHQLSLSRSPTDRTPILTIPLDPTHLKSVTDEQEDGFMRHALRFEVHLADARSEVYVVSTDSEADKVDLMLLVQAFAGAGGEV